MSWRGYVFCVYNFWRAAFSTTSCPTRARRQSLSVLGPFFSVCFLHFRKTTSIWLIFCRSQWGHSLHPPGHPASFFGVVYRSMMNPKPLPSKALAPTSDADRSSFAAVSFNQRSTGVCDSPAPRILPPGISHENMPACFWEEASKWLPLKLSSLPLHQKSIRCAKNGGAADCRQQPLSGIPNLGVRDLSLTHHYSTAVKRNWWLNALWWLCVRCTTICCATRKKSENETVVPKFLMYLFGGFAMLIGRWKPGCEVWGKKGCRVGRVAISDSTLLSCEHCWWSYGAAVPQALCNVRLLAVMALRVNISGGVRLMTHVSLTHDTHDSSRLVQHIGRLKGLLEGG